MHHNPAKNVLFVRASVEEIARRMSLQRERVQDLLNSARKKCMPLGSIAPLLT